MKSLEFTLEGSIIFCSLEWALKEISLLLSAYLVNNSCIAIKKILLYFQFAILAVYIK